ncbi:MAG TPA: DegT/DnrJ/EryC1/StrS family aminotransferase [Thermogutta sp.]|nr:DegT/DnrJ/EryC1/StrS family aminotransferase [Thermogutta sp.]
MADSTRRQFLRSAGTAGIGLTVSVSKSTRRAIGEQSAPVVVPSPNEKPALLGGKPTVTGQWPHWPWVSSSDEEAVLEVVRAGRWYRSRSVEQFEEEYAALNSARYCIATASGTTALVTSLGALGVGPGDEVIVPPFTFLATVTSVLLHYAMPVFVDSDINTFLMDAEKLESAITERTKAIIPVHIGGNVANLDRILAIAEKHRLAVVGDACQAHLAEWKGKSAGSWGTTGCYSFQLSKNLSSGEGGAILTNDEAMADACFAFHNCYRKRTRASLEAKYHFGRNANFRMTEFQAALLLNQMKGIKERAQLRSDNAAYLTTLLASIPGIHPAKEYSGCTRNAYHLYMFRYDPNEFNGLPRNRFVNALRAEGVPCSPGYAPLNKEQFLMDALHSEPYVRVYGRQAIEQWPERNQCPENDKLCEQAVWFYQTVLLTDRTRMEQIAAAIQKIKKFAGDLQKS